MTVEQRKKAICGGGTGLTTTAIDEMSLRRNIVLGHPLIVATAFCCCCKRNRAAVVGLLVPHRNSERLETEDGES
jgi:hypothetical protein